MPEASGSQTNIESILDERRLFPPPPEFSHAAHVKSMDDYRAMYEAAENDPERFWAEIARELHWFEPWQKVLKWDEPWARWFVGGKFTLTYNCLDRHIGTARENKTALIWEGEPGEVRTF